MRGALRPRRLASATPLSGASAAGTYTVEAAFAGSTDYTAASSSPAHFTITPASPSQLAFTVAPVSGIAGFNLNSPGGVQVSVEDKSGNIVTSDNSTITISIATGPAGGTFTTGSITSVQAKSGVANFTSLAMNLSGSYTLKATDGLLTAVTATVVIQPNAGLLLLDPTGQSLNVSGNGIVNVTNYGAIVVDSSNTTAASASGNASVTAGEINVKGKVSTSGNAAFHGVVNTGAAAIADPLANLSAPAQPAAKFTAVNYSGTIQPGTYVGGITVSGNNTLTLQSGIYYLTGGGLTISGNAQLTGTGVMLYVTGLTGSATSINVSGNAIVTLTPPTSGTYQGIVVFQDRTSSASITVSGNGALNTTGTWYAPKATATLSGNEQDENPANTSLGSEWIIDDLVLSGNGHFVIGADADNRNQDPNAFMVAGGAVTPSVEVASLSLQDAEAAFHAALDYGKQPASIQARCRSSAKPRSSSRLCPWTISAWPRPASSSWTRRPMGTAGSPIRLLRPLRRQEKWIC